MSKELDCSLVQQKVIVFAGIFKPIQRLGGFLGRLLVPEAQPRLALMDPLEADDVAVLELCGLQGLLGFQTLDHVGLDFLPELDLLIARQLLTPTHLLHDDGHQLLDLLLLADVDVADTPQRLRLDIEPLEEE